MTFSRLLHGYGKVVTCMNEGAVGELNRTLMNRSSAVAAPSAMRAAAASHGTRSRAGIPLRRRLADGSPRLRRRRRHGSPCMQALSWITPSVGPL